MNINRNNYEEYFILYADNELPAAERKLVAEFILANPDLEEELVMIQQSKLIPDHTLVFSEKELLVKHETNATINLTNYEEFLVLYTDNELNPAAKIQVEKFLAHHPGIYKELEILQKTKMQPEEDIVFAGKELLYRKEKDERVFRLSWWKIAAAAVVIFAISVSTIVVFNKNTHQTDKDVVIAKKNSNTNTKATIVVQKDNDRIIQSPVINNHLAIIKPVTRQNEINAKQTNVKKNKLNNTIIAEENKNDLASFKKEEKANSEIDIKRITEPVTVIDITS
ncbi:MAG: hypothetical protein M3O67_07930, partial [Bacteroidota bacterium]|nr:hypothetical protein [Bacteroidota bacterium]